MIFSACVCSLSIFGLTRQGTAVLSLERGSFATAARWGTEYWDITEAEITSEAANSVVPTMLGLTGDVNRSVLMQFGSLDLAIGGKVVSATLVLSSLDAKPIQIQEIRRVLRPWMSPGINVLVRTQKQSGNEVTKGKPNVKSAPFYPGVTWNKAGGDVAAWQTPGATGVQDSEPVSASTEFKDGKLFIKDLGPVIEKMRTHPGENFGFLMQFSGSSGFWSSQAPEDRPKLLVTYVPEPGRDGNPTIVRQESGALAVRADRPIKGITVYQGAQRLVVDSGESIVLPKPKEKSQDPRSDLLRLVVNYADGGQTLVPVDLRDKQSRTSVQLSNAQARIWNDWITDKSTYSISPQGVRFGLNPTGTATWLDAKKSLLGIETVGSNRQDSMIMPKLSLPVRSMRNPLFRQLASTIGGPLTLDEVNRLQNGVRRLPPVILLRVKNVEDGVVGGALVQVTTGSVTQNLTSDASGLVVLASPKDPIPEFIDFRVTNHGVSDSFQLPIWRVSDLYARGSDRAASIDIPFNVPVLPLQIDSNLAEGKPVSDSLKSFPAQLTALTSPSTETLYKMGSSPGDWFEIDLGRDRDLGSFELAGTLPSSYKVLIYGTTDKLEDADVWIEEVDSSARNRDFGVAKGRTIFYPTPGNARYIRFVNVSGGLAEIGSAIIRGIKRN